MENRIAVQKDGTFLYDIVTKLSFDQLIEEIKNLNSKTHKVLIVTDSNVAPLYLKQVEKLISECFYQTDHFMFPAGEESKNLDTVRNVYEILIQKNYDRHDYLLALGGGVVGDLCGYAAATYLRGISFIQVPTTLLSQVDSSIGGKTGVDFDSYKNMVGAFHMPQFVYSNISSLKTLSSQQFSSGMGEIIKHGLIKDVSYYHWLMDHADKIKNRDLNILNEMVLISNHIKKEVVEKDPTEQGERALLNFGHTLGHAIEKLSNFGLMHGHCVGLGMLAAMSISVHRGLIPEKELTTLAAVMKQFELPITVSGMSSEEIIDATKNDKKMEAGTIRFILLEKIGCACIDHTVTAEEMKTGLSYILI